MVDEIKIIKIGLCPDILLQIIIIIIQCTVP